jgi:hypothetical protein
VKSATVGSIQIIARSLTGDEFGTINDFIVAQNFSALGDYHSFAGNVTFQGNETGYGCIYDSSHNRLNCSLGYNYDDQAGYIDPGLIHRGSAVFSIDGTLWNTWYPVSIQSNMDYTYLEILNNYGENTGFFFGAEYDNAAAYSWSGGDFIIYTSPEAGRATPHFRVQGADEGLVQVVGNASQDATFRIWGGSSDMDAYLKIWADGGHKFDRWEFFNNGTTKDLILRNQEGVGAGVPTNVITYAPSMVTVHDSLAVDSDTDGLYLGEDQDTHDYFDGTNRIINLSTSGGFLHVVNDTGYTAVVAENFIEMTTLYDKSQGSALDQYSDVNNYTADKTSHFASCQVLVTDYDDCWEIVESTVYCYYDPYNETSCSAVGSPMNKTCITTEFDNYKCVNGVGGIPDGYKYDVVNNMRTECSVKVVDGLCTNERVATNEQAVYELIQEIEALKARIAVLEGKA